MFEAIERLGATPVLQPVLGHVRDAARDRVARVAARAASAPDDGRRAPAVGGRMPGDRLGELALAVAGDAGDRRRSRRARTASETPRSAGSAAVARGRSRSCDLEHDARRPAPRSAAARPVSTSRPTISAASDCGVASARRDRRDDAPAAQHGDAVGDGHHLVQLVRDEDRPSALRPPSRAASRTARAPPAA